MERAGRGSAFSGERVEPQLPETSIGVPTAEHVAFANRRSAGDCVVGRVLMQATLTGTLNKVRITDGRSTERVLVKTLLL